MSGRERRIELDHPPQQRQALLHPGFSPPVPLESCLEEALVCHQVLRRRRPARHRLGQELDAECVHDGAGDLVLHGKDVGEFPVVPLRPRLVPGLRVDQPGGDPQPSSGAPQGSLEQVLHSEAMADGARVVAVVLEHEGRCACHDAETGQSRQRIGQILGDAVAQVIVVVAAADVRERQHHDRRARASGLDAGACRGAAAGAVAKGAGEFDRRGKALGGIGRQGAGENCVEGRKVGAAHGERRNRLRGLVVQDRDRRCAGVRRRPGEHLVRHAGQTVDVAPAVDVRFAEGLLRAHVLGRAESASGEREALMAE